MSKFAYKMAFGIIQLNWINLNLGCYRFKTIV